MLTWGALLAVAVANGALRELSLIPRFGADAGHRASTVILSVLVLLLAWFATPWIDPRTQSQAWSIGIVWLTLTLAFEFLAGHYLFGRSWPLLLADYNVLAGRIWPLVLIVTLVAPWIAFTAKGR